MMYSVCLINLTFFNLQYFIGQNGADERIGRCPKMYSSRREERQTPGAYKALLKSHHQISHSDDETW